jgi:hypothetical protein
VELFGEACVMEELPNVDKLGSEKTNIGNTRKWAAEVDGWLMEA